MIRDNPIVLTQWRMMRRTGLAAPLAVAGLTSLAIVLSRLYGEWQRDGTYFDHAKLGVSHYWALLVAEVALLFVAAPLAVSSTLARERTGGQLDGNRLTPSPAEVLAIGYWLGPTARFAAMAALLALGGLVVAIASPFGLPWWLSTQCGLWSSALFVWLLAALLGLSVSSSGGPVIFLLLVLLGSIVGAVGNQSVAGFLLPLSTLAEFSDYPRPVTGFGGALRLYGLRLPPALVSSALQFAFGLFAWRAFVRKIRQPTAVAVTNGDALAIYALLVLAQHGLAWTVVSYRHKEGTLFTHMILGIVGLLLVGTQAIAVPPSASSMLARSRPSILGTAPARAVALATMAGAALCAFEPVPIPLQLVRVSHYFVQFVVLAAVLETSTMRHGKRAPGVIALAFFVLWGLPLLIALFDLPDVARFSLIAPTATFSKYVSEDEVRLLWMTPVSIHLAVMVAVLADWWSLWSRTQRLVAARVQ